MTASVFPYPSALASVRSAFAGKRWPPGRLATFREYVVPSTTPASVNGSLLLIRNQCRFTSSSRTSSFEPITLSAPSSTSYALSAPSVDFV